MRTPFGFGVKKSFFSAPVVLTSMSFATGTWAPPLSLELETDAVEFAAVLGSLPEVVPLELLSEPSAFESEAALESLVAFASACVCELLLHVAALVDSGNEDCLLVVAGAAVVEVIEVVEVASGVVVV